MKRSKFSEEQIVYAIRQAESGTPVGDLCRQLGVSDATFYTWKKKYAHLGVSELRRLRQVEEENARLKRLVADLSLDKHMLWRTCEKKSEARPPPGTRRVVSDHVPGAVCAGLPVGPIQSSRLVSTESSQGSIRSPAPDSRSGPCPPAVWVSADLGALTTRRMARESQAGATALSTGGVATPHAGPASQAYCVASWPSADPDRAYGALEHGFRA